MSFFSEFKAFAMRGNVVDLSVAVVIGAAFGKIISAMVDGIIMPLLGLLLGVINISGKTLTIGPAVVKWGLLLQTIIDFSIIALTIFLVIKGIAKFYKKEEENAPVPQDVVLLTQIRDLLAQQKTGQLE